MNNEKPEQTPTTSATDNLIPVFTTDIGGVTQSAVNARELHGFLGVKRDFSNWIKKRISEYGFIENSDYSQVIDLNGHQNGGALETKACEEPVDENLIRQNGRIKIDGEQTGGQHGGNRRSIDYHLTLDMAKELAMVEKNEKGQQARRYFINCEKQLHVHVETQQPKLSDDISLFTPLEDIVDEYQWQIHQAIEARVLLLALNRLMPSFSTNKIDLSNFLLLTDLIRSYSLQLNKIIEKDLKVPRNGEYKQTADVMRQVMLFIGKWIPSGAYSPTCFFPEFGFQTPEDDGKSRNT